MKRLPVFLPSLTAAALVLSPAAHAQEAAETPAAPAEEAAEQAEEPAAPAEKAAEPAAPAEEAAEAAEEPAAPAEEAAEAAEEPATPAEEAAEAAEESAAPAEEAAEAAEEPAAPAEEPAPEQPAADPLAAPADVAAAPEDAAVTASGLASKVLKPGSGVQKPGPTDTVTVHYSGWTTDGKLFDSSVQRGEPASFPLNGVIKGWTEGLQLMVAGEKRRFWIPADLAYGENSGGGAPSGMLVFDVELLGIKEGPKTPDTPEDVSAVPEDAAKTPSGLATKVLAKGEGSTHPTAENTVTIHYSIWSTDGVLHDSSVQRGEPATFGLGRSIKGLTEGVQLMVEGEKRRLWVPESMTYGNNPPAGNPKGTLVIDVELIGISQ